MSISSNDTCSNRLNKEQESSCKRKLHSKRQLGIQTHSAAAAMDSLIKLSAYRERSTEEARWRLLKKGYNKPVVEETIKRALACGLLDDQHFASSFIKAKLSAGWGCLRIEQELCRFGIKKESIEGYPEEFYSEADQIEAALLALGRHRSRSKRPREAAYRYLVGKGYSSDIASAAIKSQKSRSLEDDISLFSDC